MSVRMFHCPKCGPCIQDNPDSTCCPSCGDAPTQALASHRSDLEGEREAIANDVQTMRDIIENLGVYFGSGSMGALDRDLGIELADKTLAALRHPSPLLVGDHSPGKEG